MTAKKLLSIAVISRELNIPESTLHYWKNRFSEFLPIVGRGRQRRFRPESLDIFRTISEMLKLGHTTRDVKAELAAHYPLNIDPTREAAPVHGPQISSAPLQQMQPVLEGTAQIAAAVGLEIAKVIGEKLGEAMRLASGDGIGDLIDRLDAADRAVERQTREMDGLRQASGFCEARLADQDAVIRELRETVEALREAPALPPPENLADAGEIQSLRQENEGLREKLSILESELIRLRKDRRDLEKFLLEKINAVKG